VLGSRLNQVKIWIQPIQNGSTMPEEQSKTKIHIVTNPDAGPYDPDTNPDGYPAGTFTPQDATSFARREMALT
jgi:hypothetical protein